MAKQGLTHCAFDPDTIAVMLKVLDDVSNALRADEPTRQLVARRILDAAKEGERDPARLREHAFGGLMA